MNENRTIHETVIKDIIDLYDTVKNDANVNLKDRNKLSSMRSIASASSGLTLTFPMLGSRANSIDALSIAAKAQERKCTTMLQMLFSAIQVSDAGDAFKYLSQFHTNLSTRFFTVDDAIDMMSRLEESTTMSSVKSVRETSILKEMERTVQKDNLENTGYVLPSDTSEHGINEYSVTSTPYGRSIVLEARKDFIPKFNRMGDTEFRNHLRNMEKMQQQSHSLKDKLTQSNIEKNQLDMQKISSDIANGRSNRDQNKLKGYEVMYNFNRNQLMDADVRKANELMPTMLNVAFKTKTDDGHLETIDNVVCGVKCKLYAIDSEDVMDHIRSKNQEKNAILGLVRASTREISFWKDLVFAIDKAKLDALSYSRKSPNSKLWKVLERRALKSRIRRTIGQGNDASAISTLAISQNEVEYLRKEDNIDVENINVARNLLESYNLMSIIIIDEDLEVCKFLYDTGDDLWETISFNHLERESSDNTYKRVINMMTKLR